MFVRSFICKARTGQNIAFNFHFPSFHSRQIFVHEQYYKIFCAMSTPTIHIASIYVMLTKINPTENEQKWMGIMETLQHFHILFYMIKPLFCLLALPTSFSPSRSHSLSCSLSSTPIPDPCNARNNIMNRVLCMNNKHGATSRRYHETTYSAFR